MRETRMLISLLDQQTYNFRTQLEGIREGGVDVVHDARVATRRIRELLALLPAVPGRDGEDEVVKDYRRIGRALGRVRDIDVQIALIKGLEDHAPHAAPSLLTVRQDHERARLAKTRRLIKTLERIDVDALMKTAGASHPTSLRKRLTSSGWRQQLGRLVTERSHTAVDAIAHATGVYFPKRAHAARIAIKQLRYAAEIAEATGNDAMEDAIKTLRKGQEILGDLHDRHVLSEMLEGYSEHAGVVGEHVNLVRQILEREVLQLHSQYVARRASLREACGEVEHAVARAHLDIQKIAVGTALAVSGILYGRYALAGATESHRQRERSVTGLHFPARA
jgi:CHAD domain-containing protein